MKISKVLRAFGSSHPNPTHVSPVAHHHHQTTHNAHTAATDIHKQHENDITPQDLNPRHIPFPHHNTTTFAWY